jgi:hypothetical protein
MDGRVTFVGRFDSGDNSTWGNRLRIVHANGFETFYAHLHTINVKVGDMVTRTTPLGTQGRSGKGTLTGGGTGDHLHFEVHRGSFLPWPVNRVDPLAWLQEDAQPSVRTCAENKAIIQARCGFSDPEGVWTSIETPVAHRFPDDFYRKWADSYGT